MKSIILPNTLETIEGNAFAHTSLEKLELPDGLKTFSSSAVNQVRTIQSITIHNNKNYFSIDGFLFDCTMNLVFVPRKTTLTQQIPNYQSIIRIAPQSLTCTSFHTFTGWKNLSQLGTLAFHAMFQIKTIDLRQTSITSIPTETFWGNSFTDIYLPQVLQKVSSNAFRYCRNLRLVAFFWDMSSIEESTFVGCTSLKKIIYFGQNNFADIQMFSEMAYSHIRACVTDDYNFPKFGPLSVDYNWYREELRTCVHKQKFHFLLPFISVIIL